MSFSLSLRSNLKIASTEDRHSSLFPFRALLHQTLEWCWNRVIRKLIGLNRLFQSRSRHPNPRIRGLLARPFCLSSVSVVVLSRLHSLKSPQNVLQPPIFDQERYLHPCMVRRRANNFNYFHQLFLSILTHSPFPGTNLWSFIGFLAL